MIKKKIQFETLPQEMQGHLVRKLIEGYHYSYGVAAYVLVGDKSRRGLIAGICSKHGIKTSVCKPGFKHLKKGPGGVVLRLEAQTFPTLQALLKEVEGDLEAKQVRKAEKVPVPQTPQTKKYKPVLPRVGLRKLATQGRQCEEILDGKFRCGVEKAPGSRFCHWHQPLD